MAKGPSFARLKSPDVLLPLGLVVVLSLLALMVLEETAGEASDTVKTMVRGAQRGILRSALTVVGVLGVARLAFGFVGGPVMWGITAASWVLSGGYDLVASQVGLPTVGGITAALRGLGGGGRGGDGDGGLCENGLPPVNGYCGVVRVGG